MCRNINRCNYNRVSGRPSFQRRGKFFRAGQLAPLPHELAVPSEDKYAKIPTSGGQPKLGGNCAVKIGNSAHVAPRIARDFQLIVPDLKSLGLAIEPPPDQRR